MIADINSQFYPKGSILCLRANDATWQEQTLTWLIAASNNLTICDGQHVKTAKRFKAVCCCKRWDTSSHNVELFKEAKELGLPIKFCYKEKHV